MIASPQARITIPQAKTARWLSARAAVSCLEFNGRRKPHCHCVMLLVLAALVTGCGTTKSFTATEQLLVSDAVDSTVSQIDFRPLTGRKVFLDNTFLPSQKGVPNPNPMLVHSEYVTSSIRQQMLAAGVLISDKREDADIIVEARLGALGFDGHAVTYGIPASSSLTTAASSLSGSPIMPLIPELSIAKKEAKSGAAKVALFAYERQTLQPVWQSGIARASSSARDTWLLGIGPLQYGSIYEGTRFAGGRFLGKGVSKLVPHADDEPESLVDYKRPQVFTPVGVEAERVETANLPTPPPASSVTQASASAPAATPAAAATPSPASPTSPATAAPPTAAAGGTAPAATSSTATSTAPAPTAAGANSTPPVKSSSMHLDDRAKN